MLPVASRIPFLLLRSEMCGLQMLGWLFPNRLLMCRGNLKLDANVILLLPKAFWTARASTLKRSLTLCARSPMRRIPQSIPSSMLPVSLTSRRSVRSPNCAKPTLRSRRQMPKPSLQRQGVVEIDLDQPLDSLVLTKFGDSYHERHTFFRPAVVDPYDTLAWPER